jgi:hypothetical protein
MGFFSSFANAYNAMEGVKSDIQSKSILKEAAAGEQPVGYTSEQAPSDTGPVTPDTPDVSPAGFKDTVSATQDAEDMAAGQAPKAAAKAPTGAQQQDSTARLADTYNRAAEIAATKGNPALAQDFSKKAQDLARAESVKQLERLKVTEKTLDTLGQMIPVASTKEDIINIIGDTVKNPQTALLMGNAVKNAPSVEEAKKIVEQVGLTARERLDSEMKATQGEINQYKAETDRARVGIQEKREARLASGTDTIGSSGEKINKEYRTQSNKLDIEESKRLAMIDSNPYVADKDAAKASIRDEFQTKRDSLDKRYGPKEAKGGKDKTEKKPKFEEGKIYQDASGNKAKYVNGQWVPVK